MLHSLLRVLMQHTEVSIAHVIGENEQDIRFRAASGMAERRTRDRNEKEREDKGPHRGNSVQHGSCHTRHAYCAQSIKRQLPTGFSLPVPGRCAVLWKRFNRSLQTMSANPIDAQFDLRARHPNFQDYFDRNETLSQNALESLPSRLDVRYGPHPLQTVDFFPAPEPGGPIVIFIHGGYWRALDKKGYRFIAKALHRAGCAVSLFNYRLAPDVSLADIVADIRNALSLAIRTASDINGDPRKMHLTGHSAGGHLALMAALELQRSTSALLNSIRSVFSLSGLFDLSPIRQSFLNAALQLSEPDARAFSPLRQPIPILPFPLHFAVGSSETNAFIEQSKSMRERAQGQGNESAFELAQGLNHFEIVYDFGLEGGLLNKKLLKVVSGS
ncbi:MAG: hypothetical protein CBD18_08410 [Opitutales bacterium TMED158]|nr:MAG: hypothetical protein CBD18_08410 [Opitutales bacterium TMED158]